MNCCCNQLLVRCIKCVFQKLVWPFWHWHLSLLSFQGFYLQFRIIISASYFENANLEIQKTWLDCALFQGFQFGYLGFERFVKPAGTNGPVSPCLHIRGPESRSFACSARKFYPIVISKKSRTDIEEKRNY